MSLADGFGAEEVVGAGSGGVPRLHGHGHWADIAVVTAVADLEAEVRRDFAEELASDSGDAGAEGSCEGNCLEDRPF